MSVGFLRGAIAWCVRGRDPWRSAWGRRLDFYVYVRVFGRETTKSLGCFPGALLGVVGCRRSVRGVRAGMFRRRVALGTPGVLILGLFSVVWWGSRQGLGIGEVWGVEAGIGSFGSALRGIVPKR